MKQLSEAHIAAMQAGRRRARRERPKRLKEIEHRMAVLGAEIDALIKQGESVGRTRWNDLRLLGEERQKEMG